MNQNGNELIETLLEEIEELKGQISGIEADIQYENIQEEYIDE